MSTDSVEVDPEVWPDVSAVQIEDDEPVDNIHSEKQMRLLTEPLYASWAGPPPRDDGAPRSFFVAANVGLFATPREPAVAPDVMLSLDVTPPPSFDEKRHRSYFVWEFGKPPDVVVEIVSNREGDELGLRRARYARMRVAYYVVWDRLGALGSQTLHTFELRGDLYQATERPFFEHAQLGLVEWTGVFEGMEERWLRWQTPDGALLPTGAERAESEHQRAESEHQRAESEHQRAESEHQRAERLAAKLRELGVDPDELV
ncbi:MAG: Uma2 family endonuclease [Sandaracinaceae bacterium]|nr:MAG: Uma2 family endonuclease [Sandaracinaceae bacterium]HBQ14195.1 hypothetical protein [Myxococcales bacterium]